MSDNNGGKLAIGVILGAVAGAALGVLFAPRSGKETRKIVGDKSKEYAKKGKEVLDREGKVIKKAVKNAADSVTKKLS